MHKITYIKNNIEVIIFFILVIIFIILLIQRSWEGFYNDQNGINRLDAIIYININKNNIDNSYLIIKELEKLNTNKNKIHKANCVSNLKNEVDASFQSHIVALKMVKDNNWKKVLILEDDIELDVAPEEFNNILNKAFDNLDKNTINWDVLMLSSTNKHINTKTDPIIIEGVTNTESEEPLQIQKLKSATSYSAYIVKDTYVDSILKLYDTESTIQTIPNNSNVPMDNVHMHSIPMNIFKFITFYKKIEYLQNKDNWYVINKNIIKQRT